MYFHDNWYIISRSFITKFALRALPANAGIISRDMYESHELHSDTVNDASVIKPERSVVAKRAKFH